LVPAGAGQLAAPPEFRPLNEHELGLQQKLEAGSAEAARELLQGLLQGGTRPREAWAVALTLVRLKPGDAQALELLERAATAAAEVQHAAAVAHLRSCAENPSGEVAPRLDAQLERSDVLRGLLFNEADGQPPRALEVIWESTRRVLEWETVRDIKSARRVRVDEPSPLAQAYFSVARLLGAAQTPLLQLPVGGELRASVIMMGEPSVLVRGDAREDSPQLRYDLGAALAGSLPAFAIINAATYEQIDDLFRAVHSAFGPPESSQTNFTSTARLSALLWESLPPRTQRLMTQWCREGRLTRELAVAAARRAARRAGLFAAGTVGVALGRVIAEEGIDAVVLKGPEGLARLCARSPAASDLVRLASDPSFAQLRWRPDGVRAGVAPVTRRGL
jgi:predicted outer membrane lipoprotein